MDARKDNHISKRQSELKMEKTTRSNYGIENNGVKPINDGKNCIEDDTLIHFAADSLEQNDYNLVIDHISKCMSCFLRLDALTKILIDRQTMSKEIDDVLIKGIIDYRERFSQLHVKASLQIGDIESIDDTEELSKLKEDNPSIIHIPSQGSYSTECNRIPTNKENAYIGMSAQKESLSFILPSKMKCEIIYKRAVQTVRSESVTADQKFVIATDNMLNAENFYIMPEFVTNPETNEDILCIYIHRLVFPYLEDDFTADGDNISSIFIPSELLNSERSVQCLQGISNIADDYPTHILANVADEPSEIKCRQIGRADPSTWKSLIQKKAFRDYGKINKAIDKVMDPAWQNEYNCSIVRFTKDGMFIEPACKIFEMIDAIDHGTMDEKLPLNDCRAVILLITHDEGRHPKAVDHLIAFFKGEVEGENTSWADDLENPPLRIDFVFV